MKKKCAYRYCDNIIESKSQKKYCCIKHKYRETQQRQYYNQPEDVARWKASYEKRIGIKKVKEIQRNSFKKFFNIKRERFNELMRLNYQRNSKKQNCRTETLKLKYSGRILNERKCKNCGSIINLQIHHEYYPISRKNIIRAFKNGRIYYLCKECHNKLDDI